MAERDTPAALLALADQLDEGSTVLDEPIHHAHLSLVMEQAANTLRTLATHAATPAGERSYRMTDDEWRSVGCPIGLDYQRHARYFRGAPPAPDREALVKRLGEEIASLEHHDNSEPFGLNLAGEDVVNLIDLLRDALALLRTPPTEGR